MKFPLFVDITLGRSLVHVLQPRCHPWLGIQDRYKMKFPLKAFSLEDIFYNFVQFYHLYFVYIYFQFPTHKHYPFSINCGLKFNKE